MSQNNIIINGHFKKQQVTGVQRYALELLKEFDRQGICYSTAEPPGYISSDIQRQLWMQTVMPCKIPKDKILWSPTNIGPIISGNQILTLHDIADQLHPEWFNRKYVSWRKWILPQLLRKVKGVITVSKFSRHTIIERYPEVADKITVIYNGVRTEHFYPRSSHEVLQARNIFDLKKPYVITVGSLDPRKNISGLLKAWNLLPDSIRKEINLVIVGGANNKFSFQLKEEIDPSVHFLGYVDYQMLPALYSGALLFVYPSLFEGFGLPILEAMACKTPVITSNTTSLKEMADGKAITINSEEPEQISSAIKEALESENIQSDYASLGYKYAQTFSWVESANQTLAFLEKAGAT